MRATKQLQKFEKDDQKLTGMDFMSLIKSRRPNAYAAYLKIMSAKTRPLEVVVNDFLSEGISEEAFQKELIALSEKFSQNNWVKHKVGVNIGRSRIEVNWVGLSMAHFLPSESQVNSQFMVKVRQRHDDGYDEIGVTMIGDSSNYLINISGGGKVFFAKAYTQYPTIEQLLFDISYKGYIREVYFHFGIPMSMYGNSGKLNCAQTFESIKSEKQENILANYKPFSKKEKLIEWSR